MAALLQSTSAIAVSQCESPLQSRTVQRKPKSCGRSEHCCLWLIGVLLFDKFPRNGQNGGGGKGILIEWNRVSGLVSKEFLAKTNSLWYFIKKNVCDLQRSKLSCPHHLPQCLHSVFLKYILYRSNHQLSTNMLYFTTSLHTSPQEWAKICLDVLFEFVFFLVCALFFILSVCSKQTLKVYLTYSDYALSHV